MDFYQLEERDGIRLSWNCIPRSNLQHQRNVIPLSALYTPMNNKSQVNIASEKEAVVCRQCRAFINPYVSILPEHPEIWTCPFCSFSNRLTASQGTPIGIYPECSTVEYITGRLSKLPPIFLFVVDTCFDNEDVESEFQSLKESIRMSLSLLPENALVGFISFGKHVQIHELSFERLAKSYTFNGNKAYTADQIQQSLGLLPYDLRISRQRYEKDNVLYHLGDVGIRFLKQVDQAELALGSLLDSLVANRFPRSATKERSLRATGSALNLAAQFCTALFGEKSHIGGHLICFVGGACTYGPGKIVNQPLKEPIRSHRDIEKAHKMKIPSVNLSSKLSTQSDFSNTEHAMIFYEKVSKALVSSGMSCDIFIGSYDQVGLYEMEKLCQLTGGTVVMTDSFSLMIFKQSFMKFLNFTDSKGDYIDRAFNSTLECRTTLDLQIMGLIGNATNLAPRNDPRYVDTIISKKKVGASGTNSWKLCTVNLQSTYAIYFDKMDSFELNPSYIQLMFHYQHPTGELRLRVTTARIWVVPDSDNMSLEQGFDQEAATVLIAREKILKLNSNVSADKKFYKTNDIVAELDDILIKFCARYALYTKDALESFRLGAAYALLPQFIYSLRRSLFIRVFNNSPDETSYLRHVFMHEDVANSLIMIQPTLLSYDIESFGAIDEHTGEEMTEPTPVLLDPLSLGKDRILLLDTFFHILIYYGANVAAWRNVGYHEMEEYENFKKFLEAPKKEAMEILMDRFPLSRYIECDERGSQARFLVAKLNPSSSYNSHPNIFYGAQLDVLTDDASLQQYIEGIQKITISK